MFMYLIYYFFNFSDFLANPAGITFRAGSTNRYKDGNVYKLKKINQHPKYNKQTTDYDFSVIEVRILLL